MKINYDWLLLYEHFCQAFVVTGHRKMKHAETNRKYVAHNQQQKRKICLDKKKSGVFHWNFSCALTFQNHFLWKWRAFLSFIPYFDFLSRINWIWIVGNSKHIYSEFKWTLLKFLKYFFFLSQNEMRRNEKVVGFIENALFSCVSYNMCDKERERNWKDQWTFSVTYRLHNRETRWIDWH